MSNDGDNQFIRVFTLSIFKWQIKFRLNMAENEKKRNSKFKFMTLFRMAITESGTEFEMCTSMRCVARIERYYAM